MLSRALCSYSMACCTSSAIVIICLSVQIYGVTSEAGPCCACWLCNLPDQACRRVYAR